MYFSVPSAIDVVVGPAQLFVRIHRNSKDLTIHGLGHIIEIRDGAKMRVN